MWRSRRSTPNVKGVGHLVEFHHEDFMDLPFRDADFDVVLNQESLCHSADKLAYLRGACRVLKPGGQWLAMDGFLSGKALSDAHEAIHAEVYRGWHIAPLESWREVLGVSSGGWIRTDKCAGRPGRATRARHQSDQRYYTPGYIMVFAASECRSNGPRAILGRTKRRNLCTISPICYCGRSPNINAKT